MSHFNPNSFAQNQPQTFGRGARPSAENTAYADLRATQKRNLEINNKRQETRRKNKELRLSAADPNPAPAIPAPRPAQAATNGHGHPTPQIQHPGASTPASNPRVALQPILPQSSNAPIPPLSSFSVRFPPPASTATPRHTPLRLPQENAPTYPEFSNGVSDSSPSLLDQAALNKIATMSQRELQEMFRMLEDPNLMTMAPLDPNLNTAFQATPEGNGPSSPSPNGWDGPASPRADEDPPSPRGDDPPSDEDDMNVHRNAQSSLPVKMYDIAVHQKRSRRRRQPAAGSSDSETEYPPTQRRRTDTGRKTKKRPGRTQPSRSIKVVDAARQPIIKRAIPLMQQEIVCACGWPVDSPSGKVDADDDEINGMILDALEDAQQELGIVPVSTAKPTTLERNLIRAGAPTVRNAFKKVAAELVASHYDLVNPQTLKNDPLDASIPDTMYRHSILQAVFNLACFGKNANRRAHYFTGLDGIPIETLALIVSAVKCAIDGWKTGRHVDVSFETDPYAAYYGAVLGHLRGWVEFSGQPGMTDVAGSLMKEMLSIARETSGIKKTAQPTVDLYSGFSTNLYALNQPPALLNITLVLICALDLHECPEIGLYKLTGSGQKVFQPSCEGIAPTEERGRARHPSKTSGSICAPPLAGSTNHFRWNDGTLLPVYCSIGLSISPYSMGGFADEDEHAAALRSTFAANTQATGVQILRELASDILKVQHPPHRDNGTRSRLALISARGMGCTSTERNKILACAAGSQERNARWQRGGRTGGRTAVHQRYRQRVWIEVTATSESASTVR
ncbi:hypothetical protein B0H16DRAFT_1836106 [Mycena metata]|uniref:DUF6532 domain-containing protein n=1 Tax=Mycena metata TaxID=1033252 RepID=A0AAD7J191_9AGAR|nr:hypothetical protein B0H16DRAFT_1836106 [Mycena metata]